MRTLERAALCAGAVVLVLVLPVLNALPPGSPLYVPDFTLNLFGKFLAYAILALGIDLIWGYTGVLSLGHGVFFGLGAYAMGMHLMLEIGTRSVYGNVLPDFMVWNRVTELPLFWKPFYSVPFTLLAIVLVPALFAFVFGYFTFRSRIRGVYFSIITQALALSTWLMFNRNAMNLGGTNGLSGFKSIFGFTLNSAATQRALCGHRPLPLRRLPALPLHHPLPGGPGADRDPRQRDPRALLGLLAGRVQALRVRGLRGPRGRRGRPLRAAGRHHHPGQDWRAAVHRDDHLGSGRRPGDSPGAGGGGARGELAAEPAHHPLPRSLAARAGRSLRRGGALLPGRRGGHRSEVARAARTARRGGRAAQRAARGGQRLRGGRDTDRGLPHGGALSDHELHRGGGRGLDHLSRERDRRLRRVQGPARPQLLHGLPRAAGGDRAERSGQDHAARRDLRQGPAGGGARDLRQAHRPERPARKRDRLARNRPQVPDSLDLRQPERAREPRAVARATEQGRAGDPARAPRRGAAGPHRRDARDDRARGAGRRAGRRPLPRREAVARDRHGHRAAGRAAPGGRAGGRDDRRGDRPDRGAAPVGRARARGAGDRARHGVRPEPGSQGDGAPRGQRAVRGVGGRDPAGRAGARGLPRPEPVEDGGHPCLRCGASTWPRS